MSASFENLESKIIFLKIDLKKSPLIQNTILESLSEFFNLCKMYFGPLHFANHLRKYLYNICLLLQILLGVTAPKKTDYILTIGLFL